MLIVMFIKTVTFHNLTNQLDIHNNITTIQTKQNDGPNSFSIIISQLIYLYYHNLIYNEYSLYQYFDKDLLFTIKGRIIYNLTYIINHLENHTKYSFYSPSFKISKTQNDILKLKQLINLLKKT